MRLHDALRISDHAVTDEAVHRDRRRLLRGLLGAPALALPGIAAAQEAEPASARYTEAMVRAGFATREQQTRWRDITGYNNFYEFGTGKGDPAAAPRTLRTRPWQVSVAGECDKPGTFDIDDLLKGITPEQRIYRMRCVEGWSMVIPWLGVPLASVLRKFAPTSRAKYVAFTTLHDPAQMPGQRHRMIDWPYVEGLRIDEAMHPLTLLATGLYGRCLLYTSPSPRD